MLNNFFREHWAGILICSVIASAAYFLGRMVPVIGGPVIGVALGILLTSLWKVPLAAKKGIKFRHGSD